MHRLSSQVAILALASAAAQFAQEPVIGIPLRAKADDYAAKAQVGDGTFAASLIPAKQVRHMFAFDISSSYLVFEVACYLNASNSRDIARQDFVLKGRQQGELAHQVDAETVASVIQQKNLPKPPSRKPDVGVVTTVGYESGTDPYSGRRVHGVYTSAGVGVGVGDDGGPRYPTPGGLPQDRELLQAQLRARSLPEGKIDHAVAGYLFFPRSGAKTQADGKYVLEYLTDASPSGSGKEILLPVPEKSH